MKEDIELAKILGNGDLVKGAENTSYTLYNDILIPFSGVA